MRQVSLVMAVALLGTAVGACADPYAPRYGYAYQTYSYPSSYMVYQTAPVPVAPVQVAYVYPASYATYRSYDYDRNYMGIHPGPELKRSFP